MRRDSLLLLPEGGPAMMAYLSDSSWYRFPSGGRRWHLSEDGEEAFCRKGMPLIRKSGRPWESIDPATRCRRCAAKSRHHQKEDHEDTDG